MCGIIAITSTTPVAEKILTALTLLEYRGYDSAGIATIEKTGLAAAHTIEKIKSLRPLVEQEGLIGTIGIGHTRWATHGAPALKNAHPFIVNGIAVVHNGIIENYQEIKQKLIESGATFTSDTDSEVVPHLVSHHLAQCNDEMEAIRRTLQEIEGSFALAILFANGKIIGTRRGAPLAVGLGPNTEELYLASDALALSNYTKSIIYLEDDEIALLSCHDTYQIFDSVGNKVSKQPKIVDVDGGNIDKGSYPTFMLKEIHEQPEVLMRLYNRADTNFKALAKLDWHAIPAIHIVACGTSYYASAVAKYWLEENLRIPVHIDIASEFRYRNPVIAKGSLAIFVSQSGETADTLAALMMTKERGVATLGIVNVLESAIANNSDYVIPLCAGAEIGVASTKAFTAQLMTFVLLTQAIKYFMSKKAPALDISLLSKLILQMLKQEQEIKDIAYQIAKAHSIIYVGRGVSYPIAQEGALKLKELSYIHAEGVTAGELKHGSIALVDSSLPVVVIAPSSHDPLFAKTLSNLQEIHARSGQIILISDAEGIKHTKGMVKHTIEVPVITEDISFLVPIVAAIPIQLLAYYVAEARGSNIDQPRNLAKSVTVE
jgi:glucosamine--fructose-6-phosphate aminotransferase (isomerizing)